MKKTLLAVTIAALALPLTSQAAESGLEISGNFGLTSNYKFRGISQTDNKPAAQGGFDLAHSSGLYIGTWTSNVSDWANINGSGQEIDLYGGFGTEVMGIGLDLGVIKYVYPGTQVNTGSNKKPDTTEYYIGLSYGPVSYKFSQTNDLWFGFIGSKSSSYHDVSAEFPLNDAITIAAHYGNQKVKGVGNGGAGVANPSYTDYSVSVSYALPSEFTLSLAYVGTSGLTASEKSQFLSGTNYVKKIYDSSAVLTLSKSF
jgi:uncharacterized protein (TIGR02001 family)